MKTKYSVIEPSKQPIEFSIDWPNNPGYSRIAPLVKPIIGGELERVNVWLTPDFEPGENGFYTDMFVDEMGMLKNLPINNTATKIYQANVLTHDRSSHLATNMPFIYGTAVLFHRKVWF